MLACGAGHVTVVTYLLGNGADPWLKDRLGQRNCIHHAAIAGKAAVIPLVVAHTRREQMRPGLATAAAAAAAAAVGGPGRRASDK